MLWWTHGLIPAPPINTCRLNNGKISYYDACSESKNAYDKRVFKRIGRGVKHTVNNIPQQFTNELYFFVKRTNPKLSWKDRLNILIHGG